MTRLRATLVTPLSGLLALFGQASANGLRVWASSAANLPAPWTGVELDVRDSGAATGAALLDQPEVLFAGFRCGTPLCPVSARLWQLRR
ncbi:MAG TPA: hypothetical protein VGD98_17695 [Ktedonobacteraceae bacterium]